MNFLSRHWFMCGLLLCVFTGNRFASSLQPLEQARWITHFIVATVMFAMALPLEFSQIRRVLRNPAAPLVASAISMVVAPILAFPFSRWLGGELGPGLIVAAATPCTLASASVWTRKAGGNDAVSMLVTLITNASCFIMTPMWVRLFTAGQVQPFKLYPIMMQLVLTVLIPIAAAQLIRIRAPVASWSLRHKIALGVYSQIGVLAMVVLGIVQMTNRLAQADAAQFTLAAILTCGAVVLGLHLLLFGIGWQSAFWLRVPRADQIAMGFSSSQKTLMVGLSTAMTLGMSVIPLVAYHLLQLLVDTLLANWLRSNGEEEESTIVGWEQG